MIRKLLVQWLSEQISSWLELQLAIWVLGINVTHRNAMLNVLRDAIDAGAGAGLLRVYDGSRPATCGTATTLLAQLTLSDPSAPNAALGLLTFSAITKDSVADATGTATWCRVVDSTGACVLDGSAGTVADYALNTAAIVAGAEVTCASGVITAGNA